MSVRKNMHALFDRITANADDKLNQLDATLASISENNTSDNTSPNDIPLPKQDSNDLLSNPTPSPTPYPTGYPTPPPTGQQVPRHHARQVNRQDAQHVIQLDGQHDSRHVAQHHIQHITQQVASTTAPKIQSVSLLNNNQITVLNFLREAGGFTRNESISEKTGIPYGTVRDAVRVLCKKGYILNKRLYVYGAHRGFVYSIDRDKCDSLEKITDTQQVAQHVIQHFNQHVAQHGFQQLTQQVVRHVEPSSSLESDKSLTTKTVFGSVEMNFWREEGLTDKQISTWCKDLDLMPDHIEMFLKYARYDLLYNGKNETVQNPVNWFYGTLKKIGSYPTPQNYKSHQAIINEQLQAELEQQDREFEEAENLRLRKAENDTRAMILKIMDDPEDERYASVVEKLKAIGMSPGGKAFESAFISTFKELYL